MLDTHRMQQVLINLLSNANKFSSRGSSIYIEVSVRSGEQGLRGRSVFLEIQVCDQGIGIHDDDIKKLFKPFFRSQMAESRKMNPHSNGLGLSISKTIAKCLGGDLTVSSELGVGSCFTFSVRADVVSPSSLSNVMQLNTAEARILMEGSFSKKKQREARPSISKIRQSFSKLSGFLKQESPTNSNVRGAS